MYIYGGTVKWFILGITWQTKRVLDLEDFGEGENRSDSTNIYANQCLSWSGLDLEGKLKVQGCHVWETYPDEESHGSFNEDEILEQRSEEWLEYQRREGAVD